MFPSSIYPLVYFVRAGEPIEVNSKANCTIITNRFGFVWKDPEYGFIDPTVYDTEEEANSMLIRTVREKKLRALGR